MMSGVRDAPGGGGEVLVTVPSPADSFPPQWDSILLGLKGSGTIRNIRFVFIRKEIEQNNQ